MTLFSKLATLAILMRGCLSITSEDFHYDCYYDDGEPCDPLDRAEMEWCEEHYDPTECEEYFDGNKGMIDCLYYSPYTEEECEDFYGGEDLIATRKQLALLGSSATQADGTELLEEPTMESTTVSPNNPNPPAGTGSVAKLRQNVRECSRMISDLGKCMSQDILNTKLRPPFDQDTCNCLATVLTTQTLCRSSRLKRLLPKFKVVDRLASKLDAQQLFETGCKN